jgi:hypothetical protein
VSFFLTFLTHSPRHFLTSPHRVRREDLYDSASDRHSSPDPENAEADADLRAKLNARLSSLLSIIPPPPTAPSAPAAAPAAPAANPELTITDDDTLPDADADADTHPSPNAEADTKGEEEAEFTFRLFATSAPSQKVVLASDEATTTEPFTISERPLSYYLRGELTPHQQAQFQYAAVTGRDVLAGARGRAWGQEVPWRVVSVTVMGRKGRVVVGGEGYGEGLVNGEGGEEKKKRKTKPGKKRRVVLRTREKVRRETAAVVEKEVMSKEEHLREKKARLNRERKLKRRLKDLENKAAGKGEGEGED